MAVPTWTVGQVLTAADVNNWFTAVTAYKTSTTNRSTLTLTLDPDLQVLLSAVNAYYEVRASIIYVASAGAFKWNFAFPTGCTGGYSAAVPQGTPMPMGLTWAAAQTGATDGTTYAIQLQGMIGTGSNTGNLGIQWCSNSGPNSLTVGIGSYLAVNRIG